MIPRRRPSENVFRIPPPISGTAPRLLSNSSLPMPSTSFLRWVKNASTFWSRSSKFVSSTVPMMMKSKASPNWVIRISQARQKSVAASALMLG